MNTIRSVTGKYSPSTGEIGVYWVNYDYTDIYFYATKGIREDFFRHFLTVLNSYYYEGKIEIIEEGENEDSMHY